MPSIITYSANEIDLIKRFDIIENKNKLVRSFRKARLTRRKQLNRRLTSAEDKRLFAAVMKQSKIEIKEQVQKTVEVEIERQLDSSVANEIVLNQMSVLRYDMAKVLEEKEMSMLTRNCSSQDELICDVPGMVPEIPNLDRNVKANIMNNNVTYELFLTNRNLMDKEDKFPYLDAKKFVEELRINEKKWRLCCERCYDRRMEFVFEYFPIFADYISLLPIRILYFNDFWNSFKFRVLSMNCENTNRKIYLRSNTDDPFQIEQNKCDFYFISDNYEIKDHRFVKKY